MKIYRSRLLISFIAVLVLVLALAACGGGEEPTPTPEPPPPTETAAEPLLHQSQPKNQHRQKLHRGTRTNRRASTCR